jgi:predicted GH43/DUF377 family glycosyl hydrolase
MLLNLADPPGIVGMSGLPLIAPDKDYETEGGIRNDVVFPGRYDTWGQGYSALHKYEAVHD